MCHSVPVLRVEEWMLPGESLTGDTVRALIDRVGGVCCTSVCKLKRWNTPASSQTVLLIDFTLAGQQQRWRGGPVHRLGPPAGQRHHQRQAEQSKEGLSLPLGQPSRDASEGQRAGREQLQSRWGSRCCHCCHSFSPLQVPCWLLASRPEAAGIFPLLGSGLRSSGLAGLSLPPRSPLHACLQEGPCGERPGSGLAGADCHLLPQRLVFGRLLRLLGHT